MNFDIIWDNYPRHVHPGDHSVFGASTYSRWRNKSLEEKEAAYRSSFAQAIGTSAHSLADQLIKNNIRLNKNDKKVLVVHFLKDGIPLEVVNIDYIFDNFRNYVQDAIGYRMRSEQVLYYSDYFMGTADSIILDKNNLLRIHDLKTGFRPAKLDQLEVYAALFCLQHKIKPGEIDYELRVYQGNDILIGKPTAEDILPIMDEIVTTSKYFNSKYGGF